MRTDAVAEFITREQFGAGPMENTAQVATLHQFEQDGRKIARGAGLAEFVGV